MSSKKPKHDYLKQLIGRSISDDGRRPSRRHENFHKTVEVSKTQEIVLNRFIANENRYYNILVDILQPRLKTFPEFFLELTENQIELFSKLAFYCFNVRQLIGKKSEDIELPEKLEPYRDILFGIHGDKERGLSDKLLVFYENVGKSTTLWPHVREGMAYEMIDFCIQQAKTMTSRKSFFSSDNEDSNSYRVSPEVLENANLMQKRHLQLLRRDVELSWDEKNQDTKIKIPYLQNPLIIRGINIPEQFQQWTLMIIHQDRNEVILNNALWEIDFKTTYSQYLIKYLDCANPNSLMVSRHLRGR